MQFLMIQNEGVAPTEAFTLLGMSLTRDCGIEGAIGQFGSGNKLAINLLLRLNVKFWIYCGKTRLEFFLRPEKISDGIDTKTVQHVMCKFGGTSSKTIDCGWCLEWGATDWTTVNMALREFVSNAIDRTIRGEKEFMRSIMDGKLCVSTMVDTQRRALDGYTRVFIQLTESVQQFFGELPKRFLHFSENPHQVYQSILPKANRNLTERTTPMIYRCGVLVREIQETRRSSLFDYNFNHEQLQIDECRNSSEYITRAACAKLMTNANVDILVTIMRSLVKCEDTFESALDGDYICSSWQTPSVEAKRNWSDAWDEVNDGGAVLCKQGNPSVVKSIRKKGYRAITIQADNWVTTAQRMGISNSADILTNHEEKGREILPPTDAAIKAVNTVWKWLEDLGMTRGRVKPKVMGYHESTESETWGFWEQDSDTVHLREDLSSAVDKVVLKVALEEVIHYITESVKHGHDIQQFLFGAIVELAC